MRYDIIVEQRIQGENIEYFGKVPSGGKQQGDTVQFSSRPQAEAYLAELRNDKESWRVGDEYWLVMPGYAMMTVYSDIEAIRAAITLLRTATPRTPSTIITQAIGVIRAHGFEAPSWVPHARPSGAWTDLEDMPEYGKNGTAWCPFCEQSVNIHKKWGGGGKHCSTNKHYDNGARMADDADLARTSTVRGMLETFLCLSPSERTHSRQLKEMDEAISGQISITKAARIAVSEASTALNDYLATLTAKRTTQQKAAVERRRKALRGAEATVRAQRRKLAHLRAVRTTHLRDWFVTQWAAEDLPGIYPIETTHRPPFTPAEAEHRRRVGLIKTRAPSIPFVAPVGEAHEFSTVEEAISFLKGKQFSDLALDVATGHRDAAVVLFVTARDPTRGKAINVGKMANGRIMVQPTPGKCWKQITE